ncbi:hypothetical protein B0J13DRAFT_546037 [Dactylonectria estremocensis]|uniref:Uncharacterized protein n=1 Tax=Dactylonectria estremocensis TaxID=1079267 RepID=A0A9P9F7H2_9HYPO|nr:hypothetical protein B0J13DRAFT_546037 [Dactylonectria estremocensis]
MQRQAMGSSSEQCQPAPIGFYGKVAHSKPGQCRHWPIYASHSSIHLSSIGFGPWSRSPAGFAELPTSNRLPPPRVHDHRGPVDWMRSGGGGGCDDGNPLRGPCPQIPPMGTGLEAKPAATLRHRATRRPWDSGAVDSCPQADVGMARQPLHHRHNPMASIEAVDEGALTCRRGSWYLADVLLQPSAPAANGDGADGAALLCSFS